MNEITKSKLDSRHEVLAETLQERFGELNVQVIHALGEVTLVLPRDHLLPVAGALRDEEPFLFQELIDVCGVDYATYGKGEWVTTDASGSGFGRGVERGAPPECDDADRFAAVYHLLSVENNQRLRLRVYLDADRPIIDSVTGIWTSANWFEREAFDLFGILFSGHPDLRRILTDYGFVGHPFRKDFPLEGQVEMRYDPEQQRVIYEPTNIESRTLVPRVIRDDNRFASEADQQQDSADA